MNTKKHIVFILPGFPADEKDPSVTHVAGLIKAIAKNYNADYSIVSIQYPYYESTYDWNGLTVHSIGGKNTRFPFRFWYWNKTFKLLNQLQKENPIHLIHSFWLTEATLIAQRFSRRHKIKHITHAMGQDVLKKNSYLNFIDLSDIHNIVCISERQKDLFNINILKDLSCKVSSIGIDPVIQGHAGHERQIDIIGVGWLSRLKNYEAFVQIIHTLKKQHPAIKAVLIGEGPEEDQLKKLTQQLNLNENIEFKGKLPHCDVIKWMGKTKLLLHTSTFESQCVVYDEALATGCYVLSGNVGKHSGSIKHLIARNADEFNGYALQILQNPHPDFNPVITKDISESASEVIALYESCVVRL